MSEVHEKLIAEEYEKLMARLKSGSLMYGVTFNEYDLRHLVVFAYYMGLFEEQRRISERLNQTWIPRIP